MARKIRISYPGACYHIINRGNNGDNIFLDSSDRVKFFHTLIKYRVKFNLTIYAYCLMTNHIHLFIKTNEANISQAMKMINWSYSVYFNRKYGRKGHLFQSRFTSKTISDSKYFLTLIRYIHSNPVMAGISKKISEYKWCSYKDYMSASRVIINGMDYILSFFENDMRSFSDYMASKIDEKEYKVLNRVRNEDLCLKISKASGEKKVEDIFAKISHLIKLNSLNERMMSVIREKIKV